MSTLRQFSLYSHSAIRLIERAIVNKPIFPMKVLRIIRVNPSNRKKTDESNAKFNKITMKIVCTVISTSENIYLHK